VRGPHWDVFRTALLKSRPGALMDPEPVRLAFWAVKSTFLRTQFTCI
jgi:hypothetical protein